MTSKTNRLGSRLLLPAVAAVAGLCLWAASGSGQEAAFDRDIERVRDRIAELLPALDRATASLRDAERRAGKDSPMVAEASTRVRSIEVELQEYERELRSLESDRVAYAAAAAERAFGGTLDIHLSADAEPFAQSVTFAGEATVGGTRFLVFEGDAGRVTVRADAVVAVRTAADGE